MSPTPAAPQGMLYYAVYLPHATGAQGLPIYLPGGVAAGATPLPQGVAIPLQTPMAPPVDPAKAAADQARAHNQQLILYAVIAAVVLIHLPWLVYLFAVHGCWGSFLELCTGASESPDAIFDEPMLFAQVSFFILRIQSVVMSDWSQFSNVLQLSTGLGSFMLTKLVAANGLVAQGMRPRIILSATCLAAFVLLFWAEIHLTDARPYPQLADETILSYVDQMMPPDFPAFSDIKASLTQYLQFLRLADALILGAALAMSSSPRKP